MATSNFEHRNNSAAASANTAHAAPQAPGRTTLTESLTAAPPAGEETIYSDDHHDPHAAPYEHHHAHAECVKPTFDKYNRHTINDRATTHEAGRPGVSVDGVGLFNINKSEATRYTFVRQGNSNVAAPFDVIRRDTITTVNYKDEGKDASKVKKHDRLLVNPAKPRILVIEGKQQLCVLTWLGIQSSAWLPIGDLEHGAAIARVAHSRALREDPETSSHDPQKLLTQTTAYVVRNDGVGESTPSDSPHGKDKVVGPGAEGGDDLPHYLTKDERKNAFDASGKATAQTVTKSLVGLMMNLPERDTPPIAIDTLLAGDSFYVMKDHAFHRDAPVYRWGKRQSSLLETWVYGYVGMRDAKGTALPDPLRRGWLPLRTLAEASRLHTTEIPER